MTRGRWASALGLGTVALGLVVWVASHFERYTERVDRGLVGEARRNPYLAAADFLRRMGVGARSLEDPRSLDALPPSDATILIPTGRVILGEQRSAALLEWVREGGHLIVRARRPTAGQNPEPDPLLDPVGITGRDLGWENVQAGTTTIIDREASSDLLEIAFQPAYVLDIDDAEPVWEVSDPYGTRLVQLPLGAGSLTVVSDARIWDNDQIGDYSHARLLFVLANQNPGGDFLILASDDLPPLWRWLWRRAPAVVIAAALLMLAWLARAPRRFGPLLPEPEPRRRALLEHVEASGHYLWRHGGAGELEEATRQQLADQLRHCHPQLARLASPEQALRLAELSGLGARLVRSALDGEPISGREQFVRRIQVLETLRKSL